MLKVTIELVPHGVESKKETLCVMHIVNDGTGTPTSGNYWARLSRCGNVLRTYRRVEVKGFKRIKLSAWRLLYEVLKQVYEKEHNEHKCTE